MRLYADENLERRIVQRLREHGHDVAVLPLAANGVDDPEVLALANAEERVLVTNDKDFAELAFLQRRAAAGIVLVRLPRFRSAEKARRVTEVVDEQGDRLRGVFTVVEATVIRRRPFLTLLK